MLLRPLIMVKISEHTRDIFPVIKGDKHFSHLRVMQTFNTHMGDKHYDKYVGDDSSDENDLEQSKKHYTSKRCEYLNQTST